MLPRVRHPTRFRRVGILTLSHSQETYTIAPESVSLSPTSDNPPRSLPHPTIRRRKICVRTMLTSAPARSVPAGVSLHHCIASGEPHGRPIASADADIPHSHSARQYPSTLHY